VWLHIPNTTDPSRLSASSPGPGCSTSELNLHSAISLTQSLTLNAKPTLLPSLRRRWKAGGYIRLLSGLTLEPFAAHCSAITFARLSAANRSGRSSPDTRVRTSRVPASVRAFEALRVRFGGPSLKRLRSMNPSCCFSKTSEGILVKGLIPFALLFDRWITELRRDSLRRQKSARATRENDCSSWPTAYGLSGNQGQGDGEFGKAIRDWPTARAEDAESCGNHPGATDSLTGATVLWPTPRVDGQESFDTVEARKGTAAAEMHNLMGAVQNWRTPQGGNADQGVKPPAVIEAQDNPTVTLTDQVGNWPTPRAAENGSDSGSSQRMAQGPNPGLKDMAKTWPTPMAQDSQAAGSKAKGDFLTNAEGMFPTPTARDYRTPNTAESLKHRNEGSKRGRQPPNFIEHDFPISRPAPAPSTPGVRSYPSHRILTRLSRVPNPSRFERFMLDIWTFRWWSDRSRMVKTRSGWAIRSPKAWQRPADRRRLNAQFVQYLMSWPIGHSNCDCSATAWFRWKRRMASRLSELVCCRATDERE